MLTNLAELYELKLLLTTADNLAAPKRKIRQYWSPITALYLLAIYLASSIR